ncbi:MAG TPA: hypothetical protein VGC97_11815 [Pyrinomonadaceae bacterium]|jgi:hypothetical protein
MNFKKILDGLLITLSGLLINLSVVFPAFAQKLTMKRRGGVGQVWQGKKILYRVALRGKKNGRGRKYDDAFPAGACLIVRRDVQDIELDTESYPNVSRLEIYRTSGKRRIYMEANLAISRISDWSLINSPDFTWAIIPDNGEAMFSGYFYVSPNCELRQITFPTDNYDWGSTEDAAFIDAATLKFSQIINRLDGGKTKEVNIFITRDGNFRMADVDK